MNFYSAIFSIILCSSTTFSIPIFDQIGPMDGSGVASDPYELYVSQDFDSSNWSHFNIVAAENVAIENTVLVTSVDVVLSGFMGFIDPSSITNYQLNFYTTPEAAGNSLIGDVLSVDIDPADATIIPEWLGVGHLVSITPNVTIEAGEYYFGIICKNQFPLYGQVGVSKSLIGDNVTAIWGQPDNGFGNGTHGNIPFELSYRLHNDVPLDPCLEELSACVADIDGDTVIAIGDLLAIIDHFGECGDGSYRPVGDIAPVPNGDCCVDVEDLLRLISEWGHTLDCTPVGACCFDSGICTDDMREDDCVAKNGLFLGEGSYCIFEDCGIGACCLNETECVDNVTTWHCGKLGGTYRGNDSSCDTVNCMLEGDECDDAVQVYEGANPFDTSAMTPSDPEPSDFGYHSGASWDCFNSNFDWNHSSDGWYKYIPTSAGMTTFTTCDYDSYDTSIALYQAGCDPNDQVQCNGDSDEDQTGCQAYFSSIVYNMNIGETYYIRIGSWNGESVGIGTLTINPPPTGDGICCFGQSCDEGFNAAMCIGFGGTFIVGGSCDDPEVCLSPEPPTNDDCETAEEIFVGQTPFDTTLASESPLQTDDEGCPNLSWCETDNVCSPDVWYSFLAPSSATYRFSTCDPESYDTSIVLYQGSCFDVANQVACNGDGNTETGCQPLYSSLEYELVEAETYFLRVGGWEGATGIGTISILPSGEGEFGGCCVLGDCVGEMSEIDCQALSGAWSTDEFCVNIECEQPYCPNAIVSQSPYANSDAWQARISADDPTNGEFFESAANVQVAAMSSFTVWGIEAANLGGWQACSNLTTFKITTFADDGAGLPGSILDQVLSLTPTRTATGEIFGGDYELIQYEFLISTAAFDHISVQSNSEGLDCWFLWMCSPNGDGTSSSNYGNGWFQLDPDDIDDLSICIQ